MSVDTYKSVTIRVKTPDGTLFVDILEDNTTGKAFKLLARIGKSGSTTNAWVDAVAALASTVLETHGLDHTIQVLYMIRSDKITISTVEGRSVTVQSGPEGFAYALRTYKKFKYAELTKQLGIDNDDDGYNSGYRNPSTRYR